MLNIIVPMAGEGRRFAECGYHDPKPLIPIHGMPMISLVIANLTPSMEHRFIFIVRQDHVEKYEIDQRLRQWLPNASIISTSRTTEGAACTVLLARELINVDQPLIVANCDQYVETSIDTFIDSAKAYDGFVMTMTANDPKWSFVLRDENQRVVRIVEKQVVSSEATVGIYLFADGRQFVRAAETMVARDERVNGEFYVAPVYNELIAGGGAIECFDVGSGMHGLGTPTDLQTFLSTDLSRRATAHGASSG